MTREYILKNQVQYDWPYFVCLMAVGVGMSGLLCSCSDKSSSLPQTHANGFKSAAVFDANGREAGNLQESDNGDVLYWIQNGEEPIKICSCDDEIKARVLSPDNIMTAVVYVRNCGATTDWATRVELISSNEKPCQDDGRTVFIVKGVQLLDAAWENNNTLAITYPSIPGGAVYRQWLKTGQIAITYHQDERTADQSQYVEFSNFNYGLTGMAAGVHEQILLRMAGWAQEKSGMTKEEWGRWYDNPPYGDDPKEQHMIQQGIIWYHQNKNKKESESKK